MGRHSDIVLALLGDAPRVSSSGFARVNCPFCLGRAGREDRTQCLSISMETGWYRCWRCSSVGRVPIGEDLAVIRDERRDTTQTGGMAPPEDYIPLYREPGIDALSTEDARRYLESRGLGDRVLWAEVGVGCCVTGRFAGRIIVPVAAPDGKWWGWVGRAWVSRADKPYFNAPGMSLGAVGGVFNAAALGVATEEPVMVMEGVFDAMAHWPNAVAVLGKPTDAQYSSIVATRRPIVVVLDGDAWNEGAMLALRMRFDGYRAGSVRLPPKRDPDQMDRQWLRDAALQSLQEV